MHINVSYVGKLYVYTLYILKQKEKRKRKTKRKTKTKTKTKEILFFPNLHEKVRYLFHFR
jgi:hypothetical protein